MAIMIEHKYLNGYQSACNVAVTGDDMFRNPITYYIGEHAPNYPVPALASTGMCCALTLVPPVHGLQVAWDGVWREQSEILI